MGVRRMTGPLAARVDRLPIEGPPVPLPDLDALPAALLDLAVPHGDVNEIVAARAATADDKQLNRMIERCAWEVLAGLGQIGADRPDLPSVPDPLFYLYVYLAVAPHTRAWHQSRDIPEEVTRHTLADIGRQLAKHRRRHGTPGVPSPEWPVGHLRGELFELGRLQYERAGLGDRTGRAIAAAGGPVGPGDMSLELHIADFSGPLSPTACDRSIDEAHEFFARHFPEEHFTVAACHSWLLDPELVNRLPPHSNVLAFQRRFRAGYPNAETSDRTTLGFIFDDPEAPLETLPRDTSLRRAVVDHLREGGHWHDANGWFPW